mmetsp:Transcript_32623/g.102148  ORF Transcript_32623/g.102148 Transcript_32623/m.102148 type:complete len:380 (+) Transcript_32623:54-1193(+)
MARQRPRQRRRLRIGAGGALLGGALAAAPAAAPLGFAVQVASPRVPVAVPQSGHSLAPVRAGAAPHAAARRRPRSGRRPRTARRIFDTGSFFGVGFPEATVIALLGWFLLGPEELYRLAKQAGSWLGELRGFVSQAARQYESALDDDSTRKAIEGIRQTQQTVSQISDSWRSVTDSLRNPLALGSSLDAAYSKLSTERQAKLAAEKDKDNGTEPAKAAGKAGDVPDLKADAEPEAVATVEGAVSKLGLSTKSFGKRSEEATLEEETPEELERKRLASQQAVSDMWYTKAADSEEKDAGWSPERAEAYAQRLDERLGELDELAQELQQLRTGIVEDRRGLLEMLQARPDKEEAPAADQPSEAPAAVPAGGVEAHSGSTAK